MKVHRILELDGLRAFAVLGVTVFHMWGWAGSIPKGHPGVDSVISCFGPAGVHVFFIISGFIITSLLLRERETTGTVSLSAFYKRRFFRIIPPLAGYVAVLFLLTKVGYLSIKPINYVWSLLFLGNWGLFDSTGVNFLDHTWSLAIEEQYYLVLPPVMVYVLKFRIKPTDVLFIILFLLSLVMLKVAKELSAHMSPILINLSSYYKFRYIIIGVLFAFHRDFISKTLVNKSVVIPILLLLAIWGIHEWKVSPFLGIILSAMEAAIWGLFVMWFVENPKKCGLLRWRVVQWIGSASYSVYLWQQLFTNSSTSYNGWTIAQSPLSIIPIFICAALSYYLIEKPSIRLGRFISTKAPTEDESLLANSKVNFKID